MVILYYDCVVAATATSVVVVVVVFDLCRAWLLGPSELTTCYLFQLLCMHDLEGVGVAPEVVKVGIVEVGIAADAIVVAVAAATYFYCFTKLTSS